MANSHFKAGAFLCAFQAEWLESIGGELAKILSCYKDGKKWADYMLACQGFLKRVMKRLSTQDRRLVFYRKLYSIDDALDKVQDARHPQEARHALKNLLASLVFTENSIKIALSGCVNRKALGSTAHVFAPPAGRV